MPDLPLSFYGSAAQGAVCMTARRWPHLLATPSIGLRYRLRAKGRTRSSRYVGMWRTIKELQAAEMAEADAGPMGSPEAIPQAGGIPDSITFNGVQYVRDAASAVSGVAR